MRPDSEWGIGGSTTRLNVGLRDKAQTAATATPRAPLWSNAKKIFSNTHTIYKNWSKNIDIEYKRRVSMTNVILKLEGILALFVATRMVW